MGFMCMSVLAFILYREQEVQLAMPLDSRHTKRHLQDLHPNIVGESNYSLSAARVISLFVWLILFTPFSLVQRHPDHAIGGTFFWSHHEKFVVIDNRIAFLGGIDLCFG